MIMVAIVCTYRLSHGNFTAYWLKFVLYNYVNVCWAGQYLGIKTHGSESRGQAK